MTVRGSAATVAGTPIRRDDPRTINAWALYDFANSAYVTTTATALLPAYFAAAIVPAGGILVLGRRYDAQTLWAYALGASGLLVVLLAPALGAIADHAGAKRRFLRAFAFAGAVAASLLALVGTGDVLAAVLLFAAAQVGFVGGNVFYDALLPEIATPESIDRVSARGYAWGYAGGGLQFALALALVAGHERLGLERHAAVQLALGTAGLWWLGFGAVSLARLGEHGRAAELPGRPRGLARLAAYGRLGARRTWAAARELRRFRDLGFFLLAYVLYGTGVQAVIGLASVYAVDTLRLSTEVVMAVLLVVQFVAVAGSLGFARLAGRTSAKRALLVALGCWCGVAVFAETLVPGAAGRFLALGVAVGLVQGGTQSLSRSLYGTMVPAAASAQFFGVFSVFSKLSGAGGPLVFAMVSDVTGSARGALLALMLFFAAGGLLLALVDVDAARASRGRWRLDG